MRERARPPKPSEGARSPEESEQPPQRERRGGLAATAEGGYRPRYRWTGSKCKPEGTRDRGRAGGGRARPFAWLGGVGLPSEVCKWLRNTALPSVCAKIAPAYYLTRGGGRAATKTYICKFTIPNCKFIIHIPEFTIHNSEPPDTAGRGRRSGGSAGGRGRGGHGGAPQPEGKRGHAAHGRSRPPPPRTPRAAAPAPRGRAGALPT